MRLKNVSSLDQMPGCHCMQLISMLLQISMVEVHLEPNLPTMLIVLFAVCTTLVVSVHLIALFISTCILPHINAVAGDKFDDDTGPSTAVLRLSPHIRLRWYVELAWILSTGVGILLFLAQMSVLTWVRFRGISFTASVVAVAVIVPAIIIFVVFAVHFYRQLIAHKYERVTSDINELENAVLQLQLVNSRSADMV